MKNIILIGNFDHAIFLSFVEALFLVKSRKWADIEILNASESIGKQYTRCFQPGKNWRSVKLHGWRPYRVWSGARNDCFL